MKKVNKIGATGIVAAAVLIVGCGTAAIAALNDSPEPIPTAAEANALLSGVYARAVAHDRDGVCDFGSARGNCRVLLGSPTGDETWPAGEPSVTCGRVMAADGNHSGGYALRVEGIDSNGVAYTSDILAIGTEDGPRFISPVFWTSTGIAVGDDTSTGFEVCG